MGTFSERENVFSISWRMVKKVILDKEAIRVEGQKYIFWWSQQSYWLKTQFERQWKKVWIALKKTPLIWNVVSVILREALGVIAESIDRILAPRQVWEVDLRSRRA